MAAVSANMVSITRCAFNQSSLEKTSHKTDDSKKALCQRIKQRLTVKCRAGCFFETILSVLPFINVLRYYSVRRDLLYDIAAGFSLAVVHIPQGMGFALLTGVTPAYGLYSSFFPPLIYFFFSTSRHTSVGTMAVISLLVGGTVQKVMSQSSVTSSDSNYTTINGIASNDLNYTDINGTYNTTATPVRLSVEIAACITFTAGLVQAAMAILHLGWVTTFMSTSFISAFTTAAAFYIVASQMQPFFGIKVNRYVGTLRFLLTIIDGCSKLPTTSLPTAVTSLISLAFLIFIKEFINIRFKDKLKLPIPAELIVVVVGIIVSYCVNFEGRWGMTVVGPIERGIPPPRLPQVDKIPDVLADAAVTGILSFIISFSLANIFTRKHRYNIRINQELFAYGVTHSISAFFSCFAGASAPPRVFIYESTGGRTSVAYLFSCLLLLLVLLVAGPMFQHLPNCILSSIIIVSLLPLFKQFRDLKLYWKVSRFDFYVWLFTLVIILVTDITIGVGIGIVYVTVASVFQQRLAKGHVMGVLDSQDLLGDVNHYNITNEVPGVRILHFDSSLSYASVERFTNEVYTKICNPMNLSERREGDTPGNGQDDMPSSDTQPNTGPDKESKLQSVIIDCSAFSHIDIMGITCLRSLSNDFHAVNVNFILCHCSHGFLQRLKRAGLLESEAMTVYPTIQDAIAHIV